MPEKSPRPLRPIASATLASDPMISSTPVIGPNRQLWITGASVSKRTAAAETAAMAMGRALHRVDLGAVISPYIGETEKNLDRLFATAEAQQWILFFDEADALFGKRTNVRDAHDRYANAEMTYLLQKIEAHPLPILIATNANVEIDPNWRRRLELSQEKPSPPPLKLVAKTPSVSRTRPL